jgi:3,4-dihydroxy 2-butanone 4-phosphate synthase/GTP cyclohydrolase II
MSDSVHFSTVDEAIADIALGKLIIVTDDENRENEGDLIMAASKVTPQTVNMMIRYGSGIVCVPTVESELQRLNLGPMVARNREVQRTDFTVSVDAASGISTGISAQDRAHTIKLLSDPKSQPEDLVQPGHVFPLRAKPGGVLERAGHTEAAVDLARLAALHPSGVICELVNDDGTVQRLPQLVEFAKKFDLKLISIAQLIEFRAKRDRLVEHVTSGPFESTLGTFTLHVFKSLVDNRHHIALTQGVLNAEPTLVRVHSGNLLGDVFRMKDHDTQSALNSSLEVIAKLGKGAVLYMENAPTSADLLGQMHIKPGDSLPPMHFRDYGIGAQILVALGLKKIRLLSNSNRKVVALDGYGLEIVEHVAV